MDDIAALLGRTPLFEGILPEQTDAFLRCIGPVRRHCEKGTCLLMQGKACTAIGIVLSGRVEAYRPLPSGGRIPMASMGPGGVFGDVLAGAGLQSPVTVVTAEPGEVLMLPRTALMAPCASGCAAHRLFLQNLLRETGQKYFSLLSRMEVLTRHTLRGKISAWLLAETAARKADLFRISGTRAWLAEYLGCDRSALSRELSRMQADGLLETYKGSFRLLDKSALEHACQD